MGGAADSGRASGCGLSRRGRRKQRKNGRRRKGGSHRSGRRDASGSGAVADGWTGPRSGECATDACGNDAWRRQSAREDGALSRRNTDMQLCLRQPADIRMTERRQIPADPSSTTPELPSSHNHRRMAEQIPGRPAELLLTRRHPYQRRCSGWRLPAGTSVRRRSSWSQTKRATSPVWSCRSMAACCFAVPPASGSRTKTLERSGRLGAGPASSGSGSLTATPRGP